MHVVTLNGAFAHHRAFTGPGMVLRRHQIRRRQTAVDTRLQRKDNVPTAEGTRRATNMMSTICFAMNTNKCTLETAEISRYDDARTIIL